MFFWHKTVVDEVMKVAIILHNMIVVHRRDGYVSGLIEEVGKPVEKGSFVGEYGEYNLFNWNRRSSVDESLVVHLFYMAWDLRLSKPEDRIKVGVQHFSLKHGLVGDVLRNCGLKKNDGNIAKAFFNINCQHNTCMALIGGLRMLKVVQKWAYWLWIHVVSIPLRYGALIALPARKQV